MIDQEILEKLKHEYLYEVLNATDARGASALFAYANYLNKEPLTYSWFPLYMKILQANNQYAVDALLEGFQPERFFDFVVVPNGFVLEIIFKTLDRHYSNTLYESSVRAIGGLLTRVYKHADAGCLVYMPAIGDVNNLAKHLNEDQSQDSRGNRVVLNLLAALSELDRIHETSKAVKSVGRQANKVRADFLDNQRSLINSITEPILRKAASVDFGILPEQLQ